MQPDVDLWKVFDSVNQDSLWRILGLCGVPPKLINMMFELNSLISNVDFADDAVIFAETLDILLGALEVLNEETKPLGLWVSWVRTKIQAINDILAAAILSVPVDGEDVEVTERFTYLGSDIHVSVGCESEVNRRLGRAWGVMDSLDHAVWRRQYLCGRPKVRVFRSLVLPVLFSGCET